MDDKKKIAQLQAVVKQMLTPVKGVPLSLVVEAFTGATILPFDINNENDRALRDLLERAARQVFVDLRNSPIRERRPNEVGNRIEGYVKNALISVGFKVQTPKGKSGKAKSTGYPDLMIIEDDSRSTYVECKTFNRTNLDTTLRAFYLSPSDDFKASEDARHLLFAFEMIRITNDENYGIYIAKSAKLLSLEDLTCDVKFEFQSDNRRMYSESLEIFEVFDQIT